MHEACLEPSTLDKPRQGVGGGQVTIVQPSVVGAKKWQQCRGSNPQQPQRQGGGVAAAIGGWLGVS